MSFGWIDGSTISFQTLLLFDTWIIRWISFKSEAEFLRNLSIGLAANPAVLWYFLTKCPDRADHFRNLAASSPLHLSANQIRASETWLLNELDGFVVYVYPDIMESLPYIRAWKAERLLSLTDFADKQVLDIGTGTGRLAIAAASKAMLVYACEPVERLREYLRTKLQRLEIQNVYVVDGTLEILPFQDQSFDIVMSGHIFGDDYRKEDRQMSRVTRKGGWIIDCPGEEDRKRSGVPKKEMLDLGYSYTHYESSLGGDVFCYWRQVTETNHSPS